MKYIRTQQDDNVCAFFTHFVPFRSVSSGMRPTNRPTDRPYVRPNNTSLLLLCIILAPRVPAANLTVSRNFCFVAFLLWAENAAPFFLHCIHLHFLVCYIFLLLLLLFLYIYSPRCCYCCVLFHFNKWQTRKRHNDGLMEST